MGLTVLDQTSHQAATIGGEAFYCPLTPGGGLHFDFSTEATPLVAWVMVPAPRAKWIGRKRSISNTGGSARVPEHFHLRKSETRRERIQVVNEHGKMQVVNSLGAPIKYFGSPTRNMNVYQADHVGAGERAD